MDTAETPPADDIVANPRAAIRKLVVGLVIFGVVVAVLGFFLRDPITAYSNVFVSKYGLAGVFTSVFALDLLPLSLHDPVLLAGHTGGIDYLPLCATAMAASLSASWIDFALGRLVGSRVPWVGAMGERWRISPLLRRYGVYAFAVIGLLPVIPFAFVALVGGATGAPIAGIFVGSLVRASKVLVAVALITVGWAIGG